MGLIVIPNSQGSLRIKRAQEYKGMTDVQQMSAIIIDTVQIASVVLW